MRNVLVRCNSKLIFRHCSPNYSNITLSRIGFLSHFIGLECIYYFHRLQTCCFWRRVQLCYLKRLWLLLNVISQSIIESHGSQSPLTILVFWLFSLSSTINLAIFPFKVATNRTRILKYIIFNLLSYDFITVLLKYVILNISNL